MYQFFNEYSDNILKVFAVIAALYGGWKVLYKPIMNLLKKAIGVDVLESNQYEMTKTLNYLAQKAEQIHSQLTINGGTVTIKDDLGMIKDSISIMRSELMSSVALSNTPTFINDPTGSCIFVNDALCNIFGSKKEQMLGFGWTNFLDDNEKEVKAENWKKGVQYDSIFRDTYHVNNPITGKRTLCEYSANITRDKKGSAISIMGTVKVLQ
jgi:PAS domain S-box-containing protein